MLNIECEKKYLIQNLSTEKLKKLQKKNIQQFYLNKEDKNLQKELLSVFKQLPQNAAEIRVRIIDNKSAVLTLKSSGTKQRLELEQTIDLDLAKQLINNHAISKIEKVRHIITTPLLKLEIDLYKDRTLCVAELEFNPEDFTEAEIDEFVKNCLTKLDKNVKIIDVTENKNYKNSHLALPLSKNYVI